MSRIRWVLQIGFLLLFFYLLFQARFPYQGRLPSDLFIRLDPLAMWLSALTDRTIIHGLGMSLITLGLTLILGRVFCGWVCPLGTTIDLSERAIFPKRKKTLRKKNLQGLKYAVLIAVIFSALLGINFWHFLDPIPLVHRIYTMVFYPILTSAGEILIKVLRTVSERLELQSLEYLQLKPPLYRQVFLTLGIFAGIISLSALSSRFFCQNLCPLGALLGIFSRFSLLGKHLSSACTDCGLCEKLCPTGAIEEESWKDKEAECIKCFLCQDQCPTEAIRYSFGLKPLRAGEVD